MKIRVKDIKADGLVLNNKIDPDSIGLNDNDIHCVSPLIIEGTVERVGFENVIAKLSTAGVFSFECARCLEPMQKDLKNDFILNFDIDPRTEDVDLSEDIRQEIILTFPTTTVCQEGCKGLCPGCGVNLNTEKCNCERQQTTDDRRKTEN